MGLSSMKVFVHHVTLISPHLFAERSLGFNNSVPLAFFQREFPVPEQFKTAWDGSKLVTEPAEIMA